MCDYFWQRMENDRGELADIVRAGTRSGGPSNTQFDPVAAEWQLPSAPMVFSARTESPTNNFGDSFLHLRAPLLDQYTDVEFFGGAAAVMASAKMATVSSGGGLGWGGTSSVVSPELITGELETKRPCSKIFSRVLQISPGDSKPSPLSPRMMKPSPIVAGEMMRVSSSSIADPVDHDGGVQTLSPPTLGTKRRKSQAKKVVCIPAPVAASSRPTGEVVPSDLWAWRKYGQKPIKGSPYPRGYYRCSSSKGCSARKQVERSRNDPNMLVITYTSEHNHPWPIQRNALAGSTRSQASKNASGSSSDNALKSPTDWKEENGEATNLSAHPVKEELAAEMEKAIEPAEDDEFDQIIHQSYKPMIDQADDFFADLAELEADPVSLIFSKGLMETKPDEERGDKASDPFNMFDWAGSS